MTKKTIEAMAPVSEADIDAISIAIFRDGPRNGGRFDRMVAELRALRRVADAADRVIKSAKPAAMDALEVAIRDARRGVDDDE